jgi:hypothetical protein
MAEFNQWSFVFARYVSRLTPGAHDPYSPHTTEALNWFIAEPSKDSILTSSSRKSRSTALGVIEVLKCNVAL